MSIEEREVLYDELSAAYGSPYADHADDRTAAARILAKVAVDADHETPQTLLQKIKLLRQKTGDFKSKFSAQVTDKFWRKQLSTPIVPRFYVRDEPEP